MSVLLIKDSLNTLIDQQKTSKVFVSEKKNILRFIPYDSDIRLRKFFHQPSNSDSEIFFSVKPDSNSDSEKFIIPDSDSDSEKFIIPDSDSDSDSDSDGVGVGIGFRSLVQGSIPITLLFASV